MGIVTQSFLNKYDTLVPRYTSYPTAPNFKQNIPKSFYSNLLKETDYEETISIYIHIPFCSSLCYYCGCYTKITQRQDLLQTYVDALCKEIHLVSKALKKQRPVSRIHWGGGSPNHLKNKQIKKIFEALRHCFHVNETAEISMELDPRLLDQDKINTYASLNVNRVSLGVQDFNKKVQAAINRIQPYDSIASCMSWLRDAGIDKINFDLMYGLPHQTTESIKDNLNKTLKLSPERIAFFGYAHVPWMRPHQKILEQHKLPSTLDRYNLFESAKTTLIQNGYYPIGIDHFTRKEDSLHQALINQTLHRNFMGYTTDGSKTLLGFGASSISSFPKAYTQNKINLLSYYNSINKNILPTEKRIMLNNDDLLRRYIIENLMCYFSVNLQEACSQHNKTMHYLEESILAIKALEKDGLVKWDHHTLYITNAGKPFVRIVCSKFDQYLPTGRMRHAKAI